jgi:D-glycero-D-manno-heptose 1,7-bisphosphate phosphatase
MQIINTPAGPLCDGVVARALCLDLDGTVRFSASGQEFIDGPADVALFKDVEEKLWDYRHEGYLIFGFSNQGGVAHGFKTVSQCEEELDATVAAFGSNPFHVIKQCYHHAGGSVFPYNKRSLLRKPDIGMLARAEEVAFDMGVVIDWDNSLFVGDRPEDAECAANARIPFRYARAFFDREESR